MKYDGSRNLKLDSFGMSTMGSDVQTAAASTPNYVDYKTTGDWPEAFKSPSLRDTFQDSYEKLKLHPERSDSRESNN